MIEKKVKNNIIFTVFLLTFCIQTPDIKIGFVKISEIIMILLTPFIYKKSINKYFFYFLLFFTLELLIGLIVTYFTNFEILGPSRIKSPFFISIARYLELFTCVSIGLLTYKLFKNNPTKSSLIINYLVNANFTITLIYVAFYIIVILKVVSIPQSIIVYEYYRLRGFYNEGGPFGLMLSFIFILTFFQEKTLQRTIKQIILFLVIAFLAKSKAGILFIIIWISILNFELIKNKVRAFVFPIILLFSISLYFFFINISWMYFKDFDRIKKAVVERSEDRNLILGRIAGTYIAPVMIKNNLFFGIGLGNYPLVRNNNIYRQFFPKPPRELIDIDGHGFGGIVDIIVEMGLFGFLIFSFIIYKIYLDLKKVKKGILLLAGFPVIYVFGVQLVFFYPWILFGIILAYKNRFIYEVSS